MALLEACFKLFTSIARLLGLYFLLAFILIVSSLAVLQDNLSGRGIDLLHDRRFTLLLIKLGEFGKLFMTVLCPFKSASWAIPKLCSLCLRGALRFLLH